MLGDAEGAAELLVAADEIVCRLGSSANQNIARGGYPEKHDPESGLIRLEEITLEDLSSNGFSLQRFNLYTQAAAHAEAARRNEQRFAKTGKDIGYRVAGVHLVAVNDVNGIRTDRGDSVFKVLQTPTEADPAHAEIRSALAVFKRSDLLKYRPLLRNVLGPLQSAEKLRNP